ncbi:hypothetical protein OSB04_018410 [Centaurea solstitialis]|uniref:CAAX prenyl protease 2/Lysostaphin resistance protein A-like domain-containing protein n=1 Tax=Centaurea solstitialis TaxID=347529 RepID=A0AA38TGL7_9ASTR|nr:hypothetical protein OSB04_018410 [Centaurea solstitialis]
MAMALLSQSSLLFTHSIKQSKTLIHSSSSSHRLCLNRALRFHYGNKQVLKSRGLSSICFYQNKDSKLCEVVNLLHSYADPNGGMVFRKVYWSGRSCNDGMYRGSGSFVLTGLVESAALPYLGFQIGELSLDDKAEILFFDQAFTTAVVLVTLYSVTNSSKENPDDLYRYDWRDPFSLRKGWLLWAGIGLVGALVTISLAGVAMSFFSGETPQRETDALVRLLPLIGSSSISTACLLGITGVLAPVLEENVFRGFLMVSLTKWVPTPISVLISAAVFSAAHLTPGEFPQLFILGTALGFSYAQTRNLLTPITIHALWNSGVVLLLTFLQVEQHGTEMRQELIYY